MNEAYKDVRRLKMTLKTLEITWAEACCPPYTDASNHYDIGEKQAQKHYSRGVQASFLSSSLILLLVHDKNPL